MIVVTLCIGEEEKEKRKREDEASVCVRKDEAERSK
jgi:hypothetical protein